ncbi:MAG: hypothetical protein HWN67_07940 [Candidatus Helarchaeota archaeon]|nr:hypothetical protein [Candidatus Helarchaeota archaeon]
MMFCISPLDFFGSQLEFFLQAPAAIALIIGIIMIIVTLLLLKFPKVRPYFKPLYWIYYAIVLIPYYAIAGIVYAVTLSKVNLFKFLKESNFLEKFKEVFTNPKGIFNDMRVNPQKYYMWVAVYINIIIITIDMFLISFLTQKFYCGRESIIFGILSNTQVPISDPLLRWILSSITGFLVWFPTKFTIHGLVLLIHKYDKSDEPQDRPWYDKVRLLYISWGYILTADGIWCLGMVISLLLPTWHGMFFTWILVIPCGIIELVYQQYTIHCFYKFKDKFTSWLIGLIIWGLSMLPFALSIFLLNNLQSILF